MTDNNDHFILPSIKAVVDYLYDAEEKDWLANGSPHMHIFLDIRATRWWLNSKKIVGDAISNINIDNVCIMCGKLMPKDWDGYCYECEYQNEL